MYCIAILSKNLKLVKDFMADKNHNDPNVRN
jgi:hypothetical protein